MPLAKSSKHETSLDGLRGVAALIVVVHHYALMFYPAMIFNDPKQVKSALDTWVATTPLDLLIGGNFAVSLFFVLSAYVLTRKHVGKQDGLPLVSSMAKRYPRLGIPVFTSVMLCFVALWTRVFLTNDGWELLASGQWHFFAPIMASFKNALIEATTGAVFQGSNTFNGALWTMSIEFYGSLGVFLFMLLFDPLAWRWRLVLYCIALTLSWGTFYMAFILGLILSEMQAHQIKRLQWIGARSWVIALLMGVGLFLGSIPIYFPVWDGTMYAFLPRGEWPHIYHILGALCVVTAVVSSTKLRVMLESPFCNFLGTISFAMYLVHVVVLEYFARSTVKLLESTMGYHWATGITLLPTVGLVFFASWYFCHWVDKPAIQFASWVGRHIEKRCRPNVSTAKMEFGSN